MNKYMLVGWLNEWLNENMSSIHATEAPSNHYHKMQNHKLFLELQKIKPLSSKGEPPRNPGTHTLNHKRNKKRQIRRNSPERPTITETMEMPMWRKELREGLWETLQTSRRFFARALKIHFLEALWYSAACPQAVKTVLAHVQTKPAMQDQDTVFINPELISAKPSRLEKSR